MSKQKKPYGAWPSCFSAKLVGGKQRRFGHMQTGNDTVYWSESRPDEAGRKALMSWTAQAGIQEVLPKEYSASTRVHEYGGGEFVASTGAVFFVNSADQDIYQVSNGMIKRLTREENMRFADLFHDAGGKRLLAVCEVHLEGQHLPLNTIVEVSTGEQSGTVSTLIEGDDFYASPQLSPCGRFLSYISWSRPFMPWEAARLRVVRLSATGSPGEQISELGGEGHAIFQPIWQGQDLYFVYEAENWNNIACARAADDFKKIEMIWPCAADFGRPQWVFGQRSFCFLSHNTIAASFMEAGEIKLGLFDLQTGQAQAIEAPFKSFEMIASLGKHIVGIATLDHMPETLVSYASSSRVIDYQIVRRSADEVFEARDISTARLVSFPTSDGAHGYGLYYPPQNSSYEGLEGEKPPMIVSAHGGPTGRADRGLKLKIQYWTSRGFAFFDVDYRGSAGYGRFYREALDGTWGVLDVSDVIDGARWCVNEKLADGRRLIISGSSAGGLTVLNALAHHDIFSAGACYYAVSDLQALCDETHKFEIDYIYSLTNTTAGNTDETFLSRSPKNHISAISAPVIFFQGADDKVVPPSQSRDMVKKLSDMGRVTAYREFAGEGHGFRTEETLKTALSQEYLFYTTVLGFDAYFEDGESVPLKLINFENKS